MTRKFSSRAMIAAGTSPPRVIATMASNGPEEARRQASARASRWNWSQETGKAFSRPSAMLIAFNEDREPSHPIAICAGPREAPLASSTASRAPSSRPRRRAAPRQGMRAVGERRADDENDDRDKRPVEQPGDRDDQWRQDQRAEECDQRRPGADDGAE